MKANSIVAGSLAAGLAPPRLNERLPCAEQVRHAESAAAESAAKSLLVSRIDAQLDGPPAARYLCLVDRIRDLYIRDYTVLGCISNVTIVNVGIVGSIGIIIALRRP